MKNTLLYLEELKKRTAVILIHYYHDPRYIGADLIDDNLTPIRQVMNIFH